jgi:4-hydroxybenzoate polyprenyltransferase
MVEPTESTTESNAEPAAGSGSGSTLTSSPTGWAASLAVYGRFVKIAHTVFSLPMILAGMLVGASGWPSPRILLLALAAAGGARTTALALNRIIDRTIDARNPRTVARELPRGTLSLGQAWGVALCGLAVYLLAAIALGRFVLVLSPIPLIVFAGYPYLKRFTPLCHLGVGLGLALSPLGGWVAVTQSFHGLQRILPLGLFGLFWVAGFDVIYATMDEEFDRACGIHSLPAALGRAGALSISACLHLLAFLSLLGLWWVNGWSASSLAPLLPVAALLWIEQRCSRKVELAFFRINILVGFAVLAFVAVGVFSCAR